MTLARDSVLGVIYVEACVQRLISAVVEAEHWDEMEEHEKAHSRDSLLQKKEAIPGDFP